MQIRQPTTPKHHPSEPEPSRFSTLCFTRPLFTETHREKSVKMSVGECAFCISRQLSANQADEGLPVYPAIPPFGACALLSVADEAANVLADTTLNRLPGHCE